MTGLAVAGPPWRISTLAVVLRQTSARMSVRCAILLHLISSEHRAPASDSSATKRVLAATNCRHHWCQVGDGEVEVVSRPKKHSGSDGFKRVKSGIEGDRGASCFGLFLSQFFQDDNRQYNTLGYTLSFADLVLSYDLEAIVSKYLKV